MAFVRALFALLKQACGHGAILCRLTSKAGSWIAHNIEGFESRYKTRGIFDADRLCIDMPRKGGRQLERLAGPAGATYSLLDWRLVETDQIREKKVGTMRSLYMRSSAQKKKETEGAWQQKMRIYWFLDWTAARRISNIKISKSFVLMLFNSYNIIRSV